MSLPCLLSEESGDSVWSRNLAKATALSDVILQAINVKNTEKQTKNAYFYSIRCILYNMLDLLDCFCGASNLEHNIKYQVG